MKILCKNSCVFENKHFSFFIFFQALQTYSFTHVVQFVVQTTSVADWFPRPTPAPEGSEGSLAVHTESSQPLLGRLQRKKNQLTEFSEEIITTDTGKWSHFDLKN